MGASPGNQNGIGNSGGKSLQDRHLAAEVRRMSLTRIKAILEQPRVDMTENERDLHDAVILKLAGTVLPRLTEVSGPDGDALLFTLSREDKTKLDNLIDGGKPQQSSVGGDDSGDTAGKDVPSK